MRRFLIIATALLGLLALAAAAAVAFVDWNAVRERAIAYIGEGAGLSVSIDGRVELLFLPRPTIRLEGVRIGPANTGGEATILAVDAIDIVPALAELLTGRVAFDRLALHAPSLNLERDGKGGGNWQPLLDRLPGGAGAEGDRALSVEVERGVIFFHDRATGRQEVLSHIDGRVDIPGRIGSYRLDLGLDWQGVRLALIGTLAQAGGGEAAPFDLSLHAGNPLGIGLTGRVDLARGTIERGRLRATSTDLGKAAALFGIAATWPAGYRELAVDGQFSASLREIALNDMRLRLGSASASGAVQLGLGDKPRLDIVLAASQLALEPLLAAIEAANGPAAAGRAVAAEPAALSGTVALEVGALTWRDSAVRAVKLDGRIVQGRLAVARAEGIAPGGTRLALRGDGASAAGGAVAGRLELSSDDFRRFLAWLGADLGSQAPTRFRHAAGTAALTLSGTGLVLDDLDFELDTSRLRGRLALPWQARRDAEVALQIDHLDLDPYLEGGPTAGGAGPKQAAGPGFGAKGRIEIKRLVFDRRPLEDLVLAGDWRGGILRIANLRANVAGDTSVALADGEIATAGAFRAQGQLALDGTRPGELIRWLGLTPGPRLLGEHRFAFRGRMKAEGDVISAEAIEMGLDASRISGSASVRNLGARPQIAADLAVDAWAVPVDLTGEEAPADDPAGATPRPIDFSWASGFDLDLRGAAGRLYARRYELRDVRVRATVRERVVEVQRLTGATYGGWIRAKGQVDATGEIPRFAAELEAGDMALAPLLLDAAGFGEVSGKLHLEVRVEGQGQSDYELIRSSKGAARIVVTDGTMRGFNMGLIARRIAELENIGDVAKLIRATEAGGETKLELAQGSFDLVSGVARTEDLEIRMEGARGLANGWVDVAGLQVSMRGELTIVGAPAEPKLGLVLRGPVQALEREIKTGELHDYIQRRITDAGLGRPTPAPALSLEDALPQTVELPRAPRRFRNN